MGVAPLAERLRRQIAEHGPIPVSAFVEAALYDASHGFYVAGGRAGRRGDFLTAPEVGPLFGAVIARALDSWWNQRGRPHPFPVVEYGSGPGTLARAVVAAVPACLDAGALRWTMVEPSASQRQLHPEHPALVSVEELGDDLAPAMVVLANELLDNLPFDIAEMTADGWSEVLVSLGPGGEFVTGLAPMAGLVTLAVEAPVGTRLPVQGAARDWVVQMHRSHPGARLVVFDYGASSEELVGREGGWLRTFRGHDDGRHWLEEPGSCDITCDVDLDQIQLDHRAAITTQAAFLREHGIEELVAEGRATWQANAHIGDLAAVRGRSRTTEAEALLDPQAMGRFAVIEWQA